VLEDCGGELRVDFPISEGASVLNTPDGLACHSLLTSLLFRHAEMNPTRWPTRHSLFEAIRSKEMLRTTFSTRLSRPQRKRLRPLGRPDHARTAPLPLSRRVRDCPAGAPMHGSWRSVPTPLPSKTGRPGSPAAALACSNKKSSSQQQPFPSSLSEIS